MTNFDEIRTHLIKLAKDKEIPYTSAKIKKMSPDDIKRVYDEHVENEYEQINETFADMLIIKFDEMMKRYNWIRPNSRLAEKLQNRKLFKADVKSFIGYITPVLPFLGLVEGGAVIFSEVMDNTVTNKNDNATCSSEKGDQQDSSSTNDIQHDVDEID